MPSYNRAILDHLGTWLANTLCLAQAQGQLQELEKQLAEARQASDDAADMAERMVAADAARVAAQERANAAEAALADAQGEAEAARAEAAQLRDRAEVAERAAAAGSEEQSEEVQRLHREVAKLENYLSQQVLARKPPCTSSDDCSTRRNRKHQLTRLFGVPDTGNLVTPSAAGGG